MCVYLAYTWYILGIYLVYTWHILGIYLKLTYTWYILGVTHNFVEKCVIQTTVAFSHLTFLSATSVYVFFNFDEEWFAVSDLCAQMSWRAWRGWKGWKSRFSSRRSSRGFEKRFVVDNQLIYTTCNPIWHIMRKFCQIVNSGWLGLGIKWHSTARDPGRWCYLVRLWNSWTNENHLTLHEDCRLSSVRTTSRAQNTLSSLSGCSTPLSSSAGCPTSSTS